MRFGYTGQVPATNAMTVGSKYSILNTGSPDVQNPGIHTQTRIVEKPDIGEISKDPG